MNVVQALADPHTLGASFPMLRTWRAWITCLRAAFALPMNAKDRAIFQQHTARSTPPAKPVTELWVVVGRRGGKSRITAALGCYIAAFRDYTPYLAIGERATVAIIAADRAQARTIFRYVRGMFHASPMLRSMIERETGDTIDLSNAVTIEVHTCSFRSTRGYSLAAILADETAFWRDDSSASPDTEVLNALRPGLATLPGAMLIAISTPYSKRGALFETYQAHYGQDSPNVLVWSGDSQSMNPTLSDAVIAEAYQRDPVAAAAEFGGEFRGDISAFLNDEWIESAILEGVHEIAPVAGVHYCGFSDPSGGAHDSFSLSIAHNENGRLIQDCIRSVRPPFDPGSVVGEFASLLKQYHCFAVQGDRYAAEWVVSAFQKCGINYLPSEYTKSEIYLECVPLFATGVVQLLDDRTLLNELRQLERRTARGGRDSVDHPPRARDDAANACCGALRLVSGRGVLVDVAAGSYVPDQSERAAAVNVHLKELAQASGTSSPWDGNSAVSPWD
jgi:hypothetical protein